MIAKTSGSYASHQLPEGISDEVFQTNRALIDVEVLILDDKIREAVIRVRKGLGTPGLLKEATVENAEALFSAAIQDLATAQELIGERASEPFTRSW